MLGLIIKNCSRTSRSIRQRTVLETQRSLTKDHLRFSTVARAAVVLYVLQKMRFLVTALLSFFLLFACSKKPVQPEEWDGVSGEDLHPDNSISIIKSSDGLERFIKIYSEDWRGDRYSDPKFSCEASSIDRLLKFVAEHTGASISRIEGADHFPQGTYSYSFSDRSWPNKDAIFTDVVEATEEAFELNILVTKLENTRFLKITKK